MTTIHDILIDLSGTPGIKGCAVITADGIMVASSFNDTDQDDLIAGLTSFLTSTMRRVLQEGGMPTFSRLTLHCTHGKVVLIEIGDALLVVLTDQFGRIEACLPDIQEAAHQLRRQSRISMP
ncbi:MAG: roadblock/LC7 domain-containing protein [Planctomycetota bacterium]|jgi:predicted regulator of Ras-like GTPase activity (Roadblock/LC7/MglB family)